MPRPMYRFYCPDLSTPSVYLAGDEAHHALDVLRVGVGTEVELFDGQGGLATGNVTETGRGKLTVAVAARSRLPRPSPVVHLGFAVPKGKRLDWLLEKATELSAASLTPVIFQRSVAGGEELGDSKRRRWQTHCLSAAKQCGLNWLPKILPPQPLQEFLALGGDEFRILGHAAVEATSLAAVLSQWRTVRPVRLLVGPEGGLTDAELAAAREAGFLPARLGRTILRVETAAVALLAAIMTYGGD